jgi:hypothetical protein
MFLKRDDGRLLTLFFICGLIAATAVQAQNSRWLPAPQEAERASAQGGRVRPPAAITCDRNNLTVYAGKVLSYTRRSDRITLRIHTDSDTTETVTLRYPRGSSPARWFLLNGEAFGRGDWPKIESSKGRLNPNMHVSAWVCTDGRKPILDWQPQVEVMPEPPKSTP